MLDLMSVSDAVRERVAESVSLEERRSPSRRAWAKRFAGERNARALSVLAARRRRALRDPCMETAGR